MSLPTDSAAGLPTRVPLDLPPNDPARPRPLDHPTPDRPHRVYLALTNHCNRACPWCSTCSSPRGGTFMTLAAAQAALPATGPFQLQLEGGEPTVHPQFWDFVELARTEPRCTHLVLCTNGVVLPRQRDRLVAWLARMPTPLTIKLSINHHLLEHDAGLMDLALLLSELASGGREPPELNAFALSQQANSVVQTNFKLGGLFTLPPARQMQLVLNVRLRRGYANDDALVRAAVESAGLLPLANIFYLQRYGFADGETGWQLPAPVWEDFSLVNPDGTIYGPDLLARTAGMRALGQDEVPHFD